jgi:hypothetical protein
MQLDRTHVVIRVRSLSEIGDLALVMIRQYPQALYIGFVSGAILWALANAALLSWIPIQEASYGLDDEEAQTELYRYVTWMALLVALQAPAAGVPMTLYLGQAVFEKQPTWSSVFAETRRQFWKWLWSLSVLRYAIPAMLVVAFRWGVPFGGFWDVFVPILLLLLMTVTRSSRPFMPEIILLEQCPLKSESDSVITVARRSKSLHNPMTGDLSGRFIAVGFIAIAMAISVMYSLIFVRGITTNLWDLLDLFVLLFLYPLSLWIVAGLSVIARLLNYIDARIRLEGWEVELAIRAEAMRQFGDETGFPTSVAKQSTPVLAAEPSLSTEPLTAGETK